MAHTTRLPSPVAAHWDWQRSAACRGMDLEGFFHPFAERGPEWRRREQRAKQACDGCPVRTECLEHSLRIEEPYGVWGGVGERERNELIRRQRAARRPRGRGFMRSVGARDPRAASSPGARC